MHIRKKKYTFPSQQCVCGIYSHLSFSDFTMLVIKTEWELVQRLSFHTFQHWKYTREGESAQEVNENVRKNIR